MCGEKLSTTSTDIHPAGSPPRMRGKARQQVLVQFQAGITPAYAGRRHLSRRPAVCGADHPRMCGEKRAGSLASVGLSGSPPHVRGKVSAGKILLHDGGITPAYAGKRGSGSLPRSCRRDHPRVCGEKPFRSNHSTTSEGSPPRMRGKGPAGQILVVSVGITPACAGKRIKLRKRHSICGEKFHPASDRKLGRVQGTKRSSGPAPAAAPAGLAGSCPASPP